MQKDDCKKQHIKEAWRITKILLQRMGSAWLEFICMTAVAMLGPTMERERNVTKND